MNAPPDFVVTNDQRLDVSGTRWPGCRGCGNAYAHAADCPELAKRKKEAFVPQRRTT